RIPQLGRLLNLGYCILANMPDQHEISAFSEVLNSTEKPILVGGQAVNLWAEHYGSTIPSLDPLRPFMSKDADIFGDRAMAERLAKATQWRLTCYDEPRTIAVALLTKEVPGREPLLIEVINSVNGLTPRDLADPDLLELRPGQVYRVPSPIILLKAKLANVAHLDQTRRQDVRHVQMLLPCVCEYVREAHSRAIAGEITERELVNLLESVRYLSSNENHRELSKEGSRVGTLTKEWRDGRDSNPRLSWLLPYGRR
ncbi:MAG: hypothetical protein WAN79_05770, partial [Opitutaceae bacterium]